jgi:hypothetical protein
VIPISIKIIIALYFDFTPARITLKLRKSELGARLGCKKGKAMSVLGLNADAGTPPVFQVPDAGKMQQQDIRTVQILPWLLYVVAPSSPALCFSQKLWPEAPCRVGEGLIRLSLSHQGLLIGD